MKQNKTTSPQKHHPWSLRVAILSPMKQLNYMFNEVETALKRNSTQGNSTEQKNNFTFNALKWLLYCLKFCCGPNYVSVCVSAASTRSHQSVSDCFVAFSYSFGWRCATANNLFPRKLSWLCLCPAAPRANGIQSCNSFSEAQKMKNVKTLTEMACNARAIL